jgi:hypothetical protein
LQPADLVVVGGIVHLVTLGLEGWLERTVFENGRDPIG